MAISQENIARQNNKADVSIPQKAYPENQVSKINLLGFRNQS